jgi:hypothetical protein
MLLGQLHIIDRSANVRFVQFWMAGMGQYLVNTAPGHHVAGKKQRDSSHDPNTQSTISRGSPSTKAGLTQVTRT